MSLDRVFKGSSLAILESNFVVLASGSFLIREQCLNQDASDDRFVGFPY